MRRQLFAGFIGFFLSTIVQGGPSSQTLYECQGPQGVTLKIHNDGKKLRAEETAKDNRPRQSWIFEYEQAYTDLPREPLRVYSTLPELTKPFQWQGIFEFREQLTRQRNPQVIQISLIREGKLLDGWQCQQKQGVALTTQMLATPESQINADIKWNVRAVKGVLNIQELQGQSLKMLLLILERYHLWKEQMGEAAWKRQVLKVFEPLVFLSPEMLPGIEKILSLKSKQTFQEVLQLISFTEIAPLQRWIFWTQLLERGNWEAVRMGIRGFVNSSYFSDVGLQQLFLRDTEAVFKKASPDKLKQLQEGLTQKEEDFLKKIWRQSRS